MIGHEQIVYARSRGIPMPGVFLEDLPPPPRRYAWDSPEFEMANGGPPVVYVGDDDPQSLDMGFLRGLRVHLCHCDSLVRWATWREILEALPVSHLIATFDDVIIQWRPEAT